LQAFYCIWFLVLVPQSSDLVEAKMLRARSQLSRLRPEAKTIGSEATAFKDTVGVEIKVHSTSDSLTGQVVDGILIAFT